MPMTEVLVWFIPAAILATAWASYWVGKYLERQRVLACLNSPLTKSGEDMAQTLGEAINSVSDELGGPAGPGSQTTVIDDLPDEVFLARIRSPIGGEKSLVIVDDDRTTPEATRHLKLTFPNSDVQQVSRVRMFRFDEDDIPDDQDPSVPDDETVLDV